MATKANLKTLPIEHHVVTSSEIVEYLQNQLGFTFDCDFELYDMRGEFEKPMATEKCYVIMRCVFRPEDIRMTDTISNYVDKVLEDTAAGYRFKDNVIETLKPFMLPQNIATVKQNPELLRVLAQQGLYGANLERLIRRPNIFYVPQEQRFGVYLRPDEIIKDMCADPATNKVDGVVAFGYVSGANNNAAAITWGVNVYHNYHVGLKGASIEAVFNSIQN